MKTKILVALTLCLAWSANAQLITREGLTGALVGGGLGAVIGHNSGHHTGEGAAIGAGAGFVLGSLFHEPARNYAYGYSQPAYGYNTYPGYYYYPVSYSTRVRTTQFRALLWERLAERSLGTIADIIAAKER